MSKRSLFILAFCGMLAACSKEDQGSRDQTPDAASRFEIKLPSLQCNRCVAHVEKALRELDGVSEVTVSLASKTATVSYRSNERSLGGLEEAITAAGYDANERKRDLEAYDKLDACCKEPQDSTQH
ncbi:MAG: heavy-metal-associated domain-containing protein [bacterium]